MGKGKQQTGGTWVTIAFSNRKKVVAKMKEHAESEGHIYACQVETSSASYNIAESFYCSTIATITGK